MKKPSLPSGNAANTRWIAAVTEVLNIITGRVRRLEKLPANATLSEVIAAHNALLDRLQE